MPTIVNLQRKIPVDGKALRAFAGTLRAAVEEVNERDFTIALISDRRMTELNKLFRGKDATTDVLSFPNEPGEFDIDENSLGDLVVSVEQASKQAAENGLSLELEIKQLVLHGLLHLCGYDHEADKGEMNKRELGLRDKLGIS